MYLYIDVVVKLVSTGSSCVVCVSPSLLPDDEYNNDYYHDNYQDDQEEDDHYGNNSSHCGLIPGRTWSTGR